MNNTPSILQSIPELEPDIPAETLEGSSLWLPLGIAAALLLLAAALLFWWKRRRSRSTPAPSPADTALAAIAKLEEEQPDLRRCSLGLSLILRGFLSGRTQDPALYETHEEFSHRMDSLSGVPAECQYDTRCLLETLAEQKYAPALPDDRARVAQLMADTRALVGRIDAAQAARAAADEDSRS